MTVLPAIDISRLMRPRSIAIVGISPEPSSAGFFALRNLEDFGYRGSVHLVSRNQTNIGNQACVRARARRSCAACAAMPPRDVAALAATVQRIGSLLAAQPEIQEIDLNPVTVYDAGEGVLALDALIVTTAPNGRKTS